jgi:hypothetical protein
MPEERPEFLPEGIHENPEALRIIAERLRIKGAVTLRDLDLRLRHPRERRTNES